MKWLTSTWQQDGVDELRKILNAHRLVRFYGPTMMRAIPYLLITLFAALQASVTALWIEAGAAQRFTDVFQAIYGAVPGWTALAFSFGWYWLALPVASLVWLLLAWRRPAQRRNAWAVGVVSLLGFLSMMYAMYPMHVIMARQ